MPAARRRTAALPRVAMLRDVQLDPLLVGADRDFLESFPRAQVQRSGLLPLRRFGGFGLVAVKDDPAGLAALQAESDVRLIGVPALNAFGVDLFLRYWMNSLQGTPPLWVGDARKNHARRTGGLISLRGQVNGGPLVASLIATSPLNRHCPVLVVQGGGRGQVFYLHGMGGLKVGIAYPGAWHGSVIEHLRREFSLDTRLAEGRGSEDRGLADVTGTVIPPLTGESFLVEPRGRNRG